MGANRKEEFYTYNAEFTSLAASSNQVKSITIQNTSDFEVNRLTASALYSLASASTTTTTAIPCLTVLITDTGSGRRWSDVPVPVYSMFGTGQLPFILPITKLMRAQSQISIQLFNNFTVDTFASVTLSFIGKKIYKKDF